MIVGCKSIGTITLNNGTLTTQPILFDTPPLSSKVMIEKEFVEAMGYPTCGNGTLQKFYSEIKSETIKIAVESQIVDWGFMQLAFNQQAVVATTTMRETYCGTVPASPYTVVHAELTGATATSISVCIPSSATHGWKALKVITTGSPTADEVLLTEADTELTFAAANAGADYKVFDRTTYTDIQTIGVSASAQKVGAVETQGVFVMANKPSNVGYFAPSAFLTGNPTLGSGETSSLEYTCQVKGANPYPIHLLRLT
jgi:hypothetical protein